MIIGLGDWRIDAMIRAHHAAVKEMIHAAGNALMRYKWSFSRAGLQPFHLYPTAEPWTLETELWWQREQSSLR